MAQEKRQATVCPLCGKPLGDRNRSTKEHVLKRAWLEKLGYLKREIPVEIIRADGMIRSARKPNADTMTVSIGACCNNGWMRLLDDDVSSNFLGAVSGDLNVCGLDYLARRQLARWLFKTACVYSLTDLKGERLFVPSRIRERVAERDFLPPGFAAFVGRAGEKNLGIAAISAWPENNGFRPPDRPESGFKFGVLYGSLLIGCAWTDLVDAQYLAPSGVVPFFTQECSAFSAPAWVGGPPPAQFRDNPLHRFLTYIGPWG